MRRRTWRKRPHPANPALGRAARTKAASACKMLHSLSVASRWQYRHGRSTAWDVSTGTTNTAGQNSIVTLDVSSEDTSPSGIAFNSNGTKLYVLGRINDDVFQYGLTTAYDLSTASYDNISYSPPSSANDNNWYGIAFNPTYTKMFLTGRTEDKVQQFSCD